MKQTVIANQSHETVFNLLFSEDEITWQSVIYDLIQSEKMDPWNIDVSLLSAKFLETIKELKNTDFRISGKMVLAAALMLKIKSSRFIDMDIAALDQLIASTEEEDMDLLEGFDDALEDVSHYMHEGRPKIYPKTPQPRKRKVSVFDLVTALEKALEVEARRKPAAKEAPEVHVSEQKVDMHKVMTTVYGKVKSFFSKKTKMNLSFSQIIPSDKPLDKVMTFVPLLHLENQRKIDLHQEDHFGDISISMAR